MLTLHVQLVPLLRYLDCSHVRVNLYSTCELLLSKRPMSVSLLP